VDYPAPMTVNHRVAGSSTAWGAIIESPFRESLKRGFFVLRLVPFTFPILVKQTDWCYILGSSRPTKHETLSQALMHKCIKNNRGTPKGVLSRAKVSSNN